MLSAGVHGQYVHYADDFELKEHYSLKNAADAAGLYNDVAMDSLARAERSIAFAHAAPGLVATNWGKEMPGAIRALLSLIRPFALSLLDCCEFMSEPLLRPIPKPSDEPKLILIGQDANPARLTGIHEAGARWCGPRRRRCLGGSACSSEKGVEGAGNRPRGYGRQGKEKGERGSRDSFLPLSLSLPLSLPFLSLLFCSPPPLSLFLFSPGRKGGAGEEREERESRDTANLLLGGRAQTSARSKNLTLCFSFKI